MEALVAFLASLGWLAWLFLACLWLWLVSVIVGWALDREPKQRAAGLSTDRQHLSRVARLGDRRGQWKL